MAEPGLEPSPPVLVVIISNDFWTCCTISSALCPPTVFARTLFLTGAINGSVDDGWGSAEPALDPGAAIDAELPGDTLC